MTGAAWIALTLRARQVRGAPEKMRNDVPLRHVGGGGLASSPVADQPLGWLRWTPGLPGKPP